MQRRSAVKNIALTIGASIVLPSWANAWNKDSFQNSHSKISSFQENLLAEIVETIIPKTNTPGAKELNVQLFVPKMVMDCYDKKAQEVYIKGFDLVENNAKNSFSKSFLECDGTQRLEVLNKMSTSENKDEKNFVQLVKGLTIQGYLNSEYVMTNLRVYEYAPARYHGCVPVKK
jgi:hypothetical protein